MIASISAYVGIVLIATIVVAIGVLATQGLLDGKWADLALNILLTGVGGAAGYKVGTVKQP